MKLTRIVPTARLIALLAPGAIFAPAIAHSQGLGCEPSPPEAFATHAHVRVAATRGLDRPKQFSLADYLPPIADQGHTGSCAGWSTAYYCYSTSVARQRKLTPEERKDARFQFSPLFIWQPFNKGDKEQGMFIYEAFDVLAKQGCATLADMPWSEQNATKPVDDASKTHALRYRARQTVSLFKSKGHGDDPDPEKLRNWLWEARQPFVIGIPVYYEFSFVPHDPDFVYKVSDTPGKFRGGHAVCIIGYDETKHAFLMVNSWGDKWANKGMIWLDENFIVARAFEGWGQRPGGPVARATLPVQLTPSIVLDKGEAAK